MRSSSGIAPIIAGTLAALLLLFGAYMGSYYALLSGQTFQFSSTTAPVKPQYRGNIEIATKILIPAHQIDRLIRPGYWNSSGPPIFLDPSD
jgi:hypothetical protein